MIDPQPILQILRDPAWNTGGILIGLLSLFLSKQVKREAGSPPHAFIPPRRHSKKIRKQKRSQIRKKRHHT